MMPDQPQLSEAKLALFEHLLSFDNTQSETTPSENASSEIILGEQEDSDSSLSLAQFQVPVVPIQTAGSKRPIFYLHVHVEGGAFYNFALAKELGEDQPFYMLDPYMFDEKQMPPTLEAMATVYIRSLRTVQPEGPYLLTGFCGGGIIAFEMAQQLRAQNQEVDLLVLIEPRDGPAPHRLFFRSVFGALCRAGRLLGLDAEKQLELFLRLRYILLHLLQSSYRTDKAFSLRPSLVFLRRDWIGVFVWILSQYHPRRYPGKAIYFWAREEPKYLRMGWGKPAEANELEVHLVPGSHDTCRTTYLRDLAGHLKRCLDQVLIAL